MHDEPRDPDALVPGQQGDPGDLTERHPTIPADPNAPVIDDRPAASTTPAAPDAAQTELGGPTWPMAGPVEPYGTAPAASYTPSPEPRADWARSWSESTPVTPERWYEPAPATPSTAPVETPKRSGGRGGSLVLASVLSAVLASVGTVAALSSAEEAAGGITADVLGVGAAGIALTFGMWWTYFTVPSGDLLHAHRERGFVWGYGQMFVFGAIIATGAGLHVVALRLEDESHISALGAVLSVAAPVGFFLVAVIAVYSLLVGEVDAFHVWMVLGTLAVLAGAVLLAAAGVGMPVCLLVVAASLLVPVVGYETVGHRHMGEATVRATAEQA